MNEDTLTTLVARGLVEEVSQRLNESLELQRRLLKRESKTGEIRQSELLEDLGISPNTLAKWENNGLNRIVRGGSIFYLLEELHRFNY
ncbi:transcriptional regulator [Lactococcus petauri]|uniref:transcriptional regulator n=1 Tax=Lactococcus TaxID=1357 RepID=UPI001BCC99EB|nr:MULTISPECIES: transcriptional regulator [Lactococcus]MBS4459944.1 transcriptional regulator [Lactococcus petauri]MBS4463968.1 transcriptional regulator [Lactococcus garvieae]MDQ7119145.1 transcriptional regulator [Lactococcus petauri]MDQ7126981.1 transcriptional regulator [Lactococcus petauri]MDQ7128882.1 transcriptional regulator [Lactococcus petauri]